MIMKIVTNLKSMTIMKIILIIIIILIMIVLFIRKVSFVIGVRVDLCWLYLWFKENDIFSELIWFDDFDDYYNNDNCCIHINIGIGIRIFIIIISFIIIFKI